MDIEITHLFVNAFVCSRAVDLFCLFEKLPKTMFYCKIGQRFLVTDNFTNYVCMCVQLTREYFSRELKRHYQGHNNTDVFTSTWNAIMTTVKQ